MIEYTTSSTVSNDSILQRVKRNKRKGYYDMTNYCQTAEATREKNKMQYKPHYQYTGGNGGKENNEFIRISHDEAMSDEVHPIDNIKTSEMHRHQSNCVSENAVKDNNASNKSNTIQQHHQDEASSSESTTSGEEAACALESKTFTPDGGWGWMVCFSSMLINGVVFGIINTFGIIYARILDAYPKTEHDAAFKTSWIGSVNIGMTFLMSMTASVLVDKIGVRPVVIFGAILGSCGLIISGFVVNLEILYLTFGGILGIGMAFLYSPSLSILAQYFKRYIGLANGLVSFGSSLFSVVMSLSLPVSLSNLGIKHTFVFLGILFFVLIFTSIVFKPTVSDDDNKLTSNKKKLCRIRIWRIKAYVIWTLLMGLCVFGYFVPFVHIVKHTRDVFPDKNGDLLITIIQISSGLSRLISGRISDIPAVNRIRMQQIAVFVFGVATTCIPFIKSYEILFVLAGIIGVCDGVFVLLFGPIVYDIVGPEDSSQAIGWVFTIISIPMLLGPPAAGICYDNFQNYTVAFHVTGSIIVVSALMMFFVPKIEKRQQDISGIGKVGICDTHL